MAENKEPRTLGSTSGNTGTATHSTESNSTTTGIVGKVREQATAQLSSQKDRATDGLGSVAQAVRQTTQHLRDNQNETVAHYAEQTAAQIERFSQRLKNKDVSELMNDAQQLARRQPALFIGGAFALGLMGARFLKSSAPDDRSSYGNHKDRDYGGGYAGGTYGNPNYGTGGYSNAGLGSAGTSTSGVGGMTGGSTTLGVGTSSAGTSEALRGSSSNTETASGRGENAYGNRVPSPSRKGSGTANKKTDYPPTEGL